MIGRKLLNAFIFLFCVTVYFQDGTFQCFKEANQYTNDGGLFHHASDYLISKGNTFNPTIIVRIPIKNVKLITMECK